MTILKKLSDVLKEVFWIKTKSKRKTSTRSKAAATKKKIKKIIKKVKSPSKPKAGVKKPLKSFKEPVQVVKNVKETKAIKAPKVPKLSKLPKKVTLDPSLVQVGEITHFFERINVCVVKITQGTILIGDKLTVIGPKTRLVQKVWSMQIESQDVKIAKKGQVIGLKVEKPVVVGDVVYK